MKAVVIWRRNEDDYHYASGVIEGDSRQAIAEKFFTNGLSSGLQQDIREISVLDIADAVRVQITS